MPVPTSQQQLPKQTTEHSLFCRKCDQKFDIRELAGRSVYCERRKCWAKRPEARIEAAAIAECSPEDFIPVQSGEIKLYKEEPTPNYRYPTAYGD